MGKQNSKLKPEVLEDLKQNTEFSGEYIPSIYFLIINYSSQMASHLIGFHLLQSQRVCLYRTTGYTS